MLRGYQIISAEQLRPHGSILLAVGIVFFVWCGINFKEAASSRFWPSTEGRIVFVEMRPPENRKDPEVGDYMSGRLRYDYIAMHKNYTGNRIFFGQNIDDYHLLASYPVGKTVKVFYDPKNPSSSVLQPGLKGQNYMAFFSAFLVIMLGIGMIAAGTYLMKQKNKTQ